MTLTSIAAIITLLGVWLAPGDRDLTRFAGPGTAPHRSTSSTAFPALPQSQRDHATEPAAAMAPAASVQTGLHSASVAAPLPLHGVVRMEGTQRTNVSGTPKMPLTANRKRDLNDRGINETSDSSSNISGVRTIELTADELARLGVRVDTVGVWMTWHLPHENPFIWAIGPGGVTIPSDDFTLSGVEVPAVAPSLITDDRGAQRAFLATNDSLDVALQSMLEQALASGKADSLASAIRTQMDVRLKEKETVIVESMRTGRMIAILVHGPMAQQRDGLWRPDCILWYDINADLIGRLPVRIRARIQAEMRVADVIANDRDGNDAAINPSGVNGMVAGERPYLDVLRGQSGALVETSILPNPAREHAVVRYRLAQPRTVEITLHDMTGRMLRQLVPAAEQQAGQIDVALDLASLSHGMYLVAISTANGERAVQRLIVVK